MLFTVYSEKKEHELVKCYAYRILKRNILSLALKPGEAIQEKEIASRLGVSRTPVREALMALCKERLVDIFPQRGTRISLLDAKLVYQGRFLQEIVETAILELACDKLTDGHIEELERLTEEQRQMDSAADPLLFFEKDNEFHRFLFAACEKETVFDAIDLYMAHFTRSRMLCLTYFDAGELVCDHEKIVDAIKIHDVQAAKSALSEHLEHVICDQSLLKSAFPHYFLQE